MLSLTFLGLQAKSMMRQACLEEKTSTVILANLIKGRLWG